MLPVPAEGVGRLMVLRTAPAGDGAAGGGVVMDARVSRHDRRADLDRQVSRLMAWATVQDLIVR
jgi:putative resolvase